jgi:hypothetical protein
MFIVGCYGLLVMSDLAAYNLCWESIVINLLVRHGLFEISLLGAIIPAHATCNCLVMGVGEVLVFN